MIDLSYKKRCCRCHGFNLKEKKYRTICPREHDVNNPYWRIPEDADKLKYRPYCGKKIVIIE